VAAPAMPGGPGAQNVDLNWLNVLWNNTFRQIFNCCWRYAVLHRMFFHASHDRPTKGFIL